VRKWNHQDVKAWQLHNRNNIELTKEPFFCTGPYEIRKGEGELLYKQKCAIFVEDTVSGKCAISMEDTN